MKLDKQITDLKSKYDHLNDQLMNSENLDNKQIIQINKDLSKLEPIISLSDTIKKLENIPTCMVMTQPTPVITQIYFMTPGLNIYGLEKQHMLSAKTVERTFQFCQSSLFKSL